MGVDLDLEKFFDLVCHQRLAAKLAERVSDRRLLGLIGRMLKAKVVLPDGVVIDSEQGVPQGGPLSPLLSNIVLDELDQELARRGHRFARYADDAKVYVRSERAGQRVMASLTEFIEGRLRLKVNRGQVGCRPTRGSPFPRLSAAIRPADRGRGGAALGAHQAQRDGAHPPAHAAQLGKQSWLTASPGSTRGWAGGIGFFGIASVEEMQMMRKIDAHIRRRLRAIILRHWKRKRTIAKRLVALGVNPRAAWHQVYQGRRSGGR